MLEFHMAITHEAAWQHLLNQSEVRVEAAARRLLKEGAAAWAGCGSWSPAQVLAHLWDSVQVNHLRILRAMEGENLVLEGYDQDRWVALQAAELLPWRILVEGWCLDNLRLLHLARRVETGARRRPRHPHSLDRIAWQPFRAEESASLEDLLRDYLGHLWHHLGRLSPSLTPPMALVPLQGAVKLPLRGPRVVLREFQEQDLDAVAALLADEEVVRHLPGPPRNREQSARTLDFFQRQHQRDGCSAWALHEGDMGHCLGWCGLAEFDSTGHVELLYCLERAAWGRGLASEAAALCVEAARGELGLPGLVAAVDPPNTASRRVLEKVGFHKWRQARHFGMLLDLYRLEF